MYVFIYYIFTSIYVQDVFKNHFQLYTINTGQQHKADTSH